MEADSPSARDVSADYAAAVDYLVGLKVRGVRPGLERMRRLLEAMGSPERQVPVIHIAGTNGKGSVAAMVEGIFRSAGWRTGLYTSPHLVRLGERVQVNRRPLSEEAIVEGVHALRPIAASLARMDDEGGHPSYFEFMTAMAFRHFARERCDIVVVEAGMGGRLDATNVVMPEVSVITSVGLDHCEMLGHSLEAIAGEKAGIIKPGAPVVTGHLPPDADRVVRARAASQGVAVHAVEETFGRDPELYPETNLEGQFQRVNAGVALLVSRLMAPRWRISDAVARGALQGIHWPGRWQRLSVQSRLLILDASHNEEGSRGLDRNLARLVAETGRPPVVITGVLGEARAGPLLEVICRHAGEVHLVVPGQARACTHEQLMRCVPAGFGGRVVRARLADLFPKEGQVAGVGGEGAIVVTGSIALLGEVMARWDASGGAAEGMLQDF